MWTVQEAKSKLSKLLDRARKGEAQIIGTRDPCVVMSMAEYERLRGRAGDEPHLGRWLVENLEVSAKSNCLPEERIGRARSPIGRKRTFGSERGGMAPRYECALRIDAA